VKLDNDGVASSEERAGGRPTHVVVAEDDRSYLRRLTGILERSGYTPHAARDGDEAWALLMQTKAQLLVTDWTMPGMSGVELCRKVKSANLPYYVYSIVLTSRREEQEIVEGFNSGADDYLTKPVNSAELKARIQVGARIVRLESKLRDRESVLRDREKELQVLVRRLEVMVSTDDLTGVANRRALLARLTEELAQARRTGHDLSVAMIDIDRFKRLNDTYGHAAGDLVLREIVNRVLGAKREYDIVGRLGGEEFVVILPELALEEAVAVAERLRAQVADAPFVLSSGSRLSATFSVGVASAPAGRAESIDSLLAAADRALYRAKERGRNRVEIDRGSLEQDAEAPTAQESRSMRRTDEAA
jgi:two-component system chemotaxis response regulator CheY